MGLVAVQNCRFQVFGVEEPRKGIRGCQGSSAYAAFTFFNLEGGWLGRLWVHTLSLYCAAGGSQVPGPAHSQSPTVAAGMKSST